MVMSLAEAATVNRSKRVFALLNLYRERAQRESVYKMGLPIGDLAVRGQRRQSGSARADPPQLRELGRSRRRLAAAAPRTSCRRVRIYAGSRASF